MAGNNTLSTLKLNALNLGCTSLEEDTFGYSNGWTNTGGGFNLYSPTIIPFQTNLSLQFTNIFNTLFAIGGEQSFAAIPFNEYMFESRPAFEDSFVTFPKRIEVFAATMPTVIDPSSGDDYNERVARFTYYTNFNMALVDDVAFTNSTFKVVIDNNKVINTTDNYYGQNFGTPNPFTPYNPTNSAFVEIISGFNTTPLSLHSNQNSGSEIIELPFTDNGLNLVFRFHSQGYYNAASSSPSNFTANVNLKGYIKIS